MSVSYEPQGFCPDCGYRMDTGRCPECGRVVERPAREHPRSRRRRLRRWGLIIVGLSFLCGLGYFYRGALAYQFWPTWHLCLLKQSVGDWSRWADQILQQRAKAAVAVEKPLAEARKKRIGAELQKLGAHDWAGVYGKHGQIMLAPESGFVLQFGANFNHGGRFEALTDRIRFYPSIDPRLPGFTLPCEWLRVRWHGQRYLVHSAAMVEFCNQINSHAHLVWGTWFQRLGDTEDPADSVIEVPAEYRRLIFSTPLVAELVELLDPLHSKRDGGRNGWYYMQTVQISAGSRSGVFKGMRFWSSHLNDRGWFDVVEVSENTCTADYTTYYLNDENENIKLFPEVGWKVSTCKP